MYRSVSTWKCLASHWDSELFAFSDVIQQINTVTSGWYPCCFHHWLVRANQEVRTGVCVIVPKSLSTFRAWKALLWCGRSFSCIANSVKLSGRSDLFVFDTLWVSCSHVRWLMGNMWSYTHEIKPGADPSPWVATALCTLCVYVDTRAIWYFVWVTGASRVVRSELCQEW